MYVHPKGARHLADPTRLVDSAARVYGPLLDSLYGRLDPTPAERIHVLEDGEAIPVSSNRSLIAVDSPGHAKHHVALHDTLSGVLFAGDAVGVKLPDAGVLRPSTPRRTSISPRRSPPCGVSPNGALPGWLWPTTGCSPTRWTCWTRPTGPSGNGPTSPSRPSATVEDIAAALAAEFESDLDGVPEEHREKLEVMNGVHSNAAGLHRWLSTRDAGRVLRHRRSVRGVPVWTEVGPRVVNISIVTGWLPLVVQGLAVVTLVRRVEWRTGGWRRQLGIGAAHRCRRHRTGRAGADPGVPGSRRRSLAGLPLGLRDRTGRGVAAVGWGQAGTGRRCWRWSPWCCSRLVTAGGAVNQRSDTFPTIGRLITPIPSTWWVPRSCAS